ncbi:MAG: hypothetical protein ABUL68_01135 [Pseudomonadota bacterium]
MKVFAICTIVNHAGQYAAMRESFLAAGFDEERCVYDHLDNRGGNRHEPYAAFNRSKSAARARYLICCHQDVLLSQGHGYADLLRALEELSARDPTWAVAGNAGVNLRYQLVARITDRVGTPAWTGALPEQVAGVDENFLVVNLGVEPDTIYWSENLSGFHFYGSDVCLNASRHGRRSYVIDFQLEHLGQGILSPEFWAIKARFQCHWEKSFRVAYMISPTMIPIVLTRYAWLRRLADLPAVQKRLLRPRSLRLAHWCGLSPVPPKPAG